MNPPSLDEIRKMSPGIERAKLINAYLKSGEAKLHEARRLRDEDFRVVAEKLGPAKTAREIGGVSLSTVKLGIGRR